MTDHDDDARRDIYRQLGETYSHGIVMATDCGLKNGVDPNHAAGVLVSTAISVLYSQGATPDEIADWLRKYAERATMLCGRLAGIEAEGATKQ